jgi:hypothetical protein
MSVSSFSDLPLADRSRRGNGGAAEKRVRTWAKAQEGPNARYCKANLCYASDNRKMDETPPWKSP